MDLFQKRCTVSGILRIILFASLVAGIAPLKFEKVRNGWRVRISKAANVYGKFLVVCLCVLACSNVTSALSGTVKPFNLRTTQELVVAVFILVTTLPVALTASFSAMDRMRHMVNYFAQLETMNTQLYEITNCKKQMPNEWKMFVFIILILCLGIFTICTEYAIFIHQVAYEQGRVYLQCFHIFYYILIEYIQLIGIQFFLISSTVLYSFKLFNTCLKYVLKKTCDEDQLNNQRNKVSDTVRYLSLTYCSLCDMVQTFNECHGFLLAQQLLSCLLLLIVTLYHLFMRLLFKNGITNNETEASELYMALLQFIWLWYHVINIVIVIEPCHRTHREMETTKILVSKLMRHMPPSQHEFNSELLLFYRYLMMYDVKYAPLNMFTLNRRLFTTILGSITTYLVVVLSF